MTPPTHRRGRFIVVEGLDGSGKTTVAAAVAERLHAHLVRTPPPPFDRIRSDIDNRASVEARFLFYLAGVAYAADEVSRLLHDADVVCDRYLASTVAYHSAMGARMASRYQQQDLLEPDVVVFLSINDESERRRRIDNRAHRTSADDLLNDDRFRQRLLRAYGRFEMERIETSTLTFAEVVETVLAVVADLPCEMESNGSSRKP